MYIALHHPGGSEIVLASKNPLNIWGGVYILVYHTRKNISRLPSSSSLISTPHTTFLHLFSSLFILFIPFNVSFYFNLSVFLSHFQHFPRFSLHLFRSFPTGGRVYKNINTCLPKGRGYFQNKHLPHYGQRYFFISTPVTLEGVYFSTNSFVTKSEGGNFLI